MYIMTNKKYYYLLIILFLVILTIRLLIAFKEPYLSDDLSYFSLRQAQIIKEIGIPAYNDELSQNGRYFFFLPLMHYIIAFLLFFFEPIIAVKIYTNFFSTLIIFPIFLIVKQITKDKKIALLSSFLVSFIPIYVSETINSASIYSISIPLSVYLMHYFLKINTKKKPGIFIILLLLFIFLSPSVLVIVLGIITYLIFAWIEKLNIKRAEIELCIFSIFITGFIYIALYRDALIMHGPKIIYANIPTIFLNNYFSNINLNIILIGLGILPLIATIAITYIFIKEKKKKSFFLPLSILFVCSIMLILKLIPFTLGLIYIGILCVILFGEGFQYIIEYIKKTKFSNYIFLFYLLFILLFTLTSVIPSYVMAINSIKKSTDNEIVIGLKKIMENSNNDISIIWDIEKGHTITYFSKRKNVIDTNYLYSNDIEIRLNDVRVIYSSAIVTKPIEIMQKYNAEFLIFDKNIKKRYNISKVSYINDECFNEFFYGEEIMIYKRECNLI
jgi:hypothetical protein